MNCARARTLLIEWLDESLDEHLSEAVELHVERCSSCQRLVVDTVDGAARHGAFRASLAALEELAPAKDPVPFSMPRADRKRSQATRPLRVASIAATLLVAATVLLLADRSNAEHQILDALRRGSGKLENAVYRRENVTAGRSGELIVRASGQRVETLVDQGNVIAASGFDGRWNWEFEGEGDLLRLAADDAAVSPVVRNLLDGAALADLLQRGFELRSRGETPVDGHPCWELECSEPSGEALTLFVDRVLKVVRRFIDGKDDFVLDAMNRSLAPQAFDGRRFANERTMIQIVAFGAVQQGSQFEKLLAEGGSLKFEPLMGVLPKDGLSALPPGILEKLKGSLPFDVSISGSVSQPRSIIFGDSKLLADDGTLPLALERRIDRAEIAAASDFEAIVACIERATGMDVVFAPKLDAPYVKIFSFADMSAWMVLNSLAITQGMTIRVEGTTVVIE